MFRGFSPSKIVFLFCGIEERTGFCEGYSFYKDISLLEGKGVLGSIKSDMDRGSKGLRFAQSHNFSKKLLHKAAYLPREA
jgi:hypothetical protein